MLRTTPSSESGGIRVPRACAPCAHAKVRCETGNGEAVCRRCRRLNKACTTQPPGQHKRKAGKASDVKRLEQKLDGVTALLAASDRIRFGTIDSQFLLSTSTPPDQSSTLSPEACGRQFFSDTQEAETILGVYRADMEPHFPFVALPPSMTAKDMRHSKPFLFLNIMMAGCRHDVERQAAAAMKIREVISYNMLLREERSLDFFQGLLVYLSRYHLHLQFGSQLTNLLHLAFSMMIDLGLHRASFVKSSSMLAISTLHFLKEDKISPRVPSLEDRRAFLGCFFLSSVVSICSRDMDPVRYTRHAEECCNVIIEAAEYPSDVYLVQLVRLHRLADKIRRSLSCDDVGVSMTMAAPLGALVKALESEVIQVKSSLPTTIPQTASLLLHFHAVSIYLYEVPFKDSASTGYDPSNTYPLTRLNFLFSCLTSTKLFLETFFAIRSVEYLDMPYFTWSLLGHTIVLLSKLTLYTCDGWDQDYVRNTVDFGQTVDLLADKVEEAKRMCEVFNDDHELRRGVPEVFLALPSKLQQVKQKHDLKRQAQMKPRADFQASETEASTVRLEEYELQAAGAQPVLFEFLNDSFWQQFT